MRGRPPAAASCASALAGVFTLAVPGVARAQGVDQGSVARDDLGLAAALLALAGWIVYAVAHSWWGRGRSVFRAEIDTEPSLELLDDPPVVVEALRSGGRAPMSVVGLVVLDLARRGYLTIVEVSRPEGRDWRFVRLERPQGGLEPYENAVYTRLFAGGNEASGSSLVRWGDANRAQARVFVDRVRKYVANEMAQRGYLKEPSRVPVLVNLGATFLVGLVAVTALAQGALLGLVALVSAIGQGSLSGGLRRRTTTSADRSEEWFGVARGLQTVDEVETPPASSVEEWDRCLVYAVALGVGETFVGSLRRRADVETGELAEWYSAEGDHVDRLQAAVRLPMRLGQAFGRAVERNVPSVGSLPGAASVRGRLGEAGQAGEAGWTLAPSDPFGSDE